MIICGDCNQPVNKPIIKHIRDKHLTAYLGYLHTNELAREKKRQYELSKKYEDKWMEGEYGL